MTIKKLSKYKGEAQLGRCVECGEFETDFHRLYRLQFNSSSICLCPDCFRKTRVKFDEYAETEQELKNDKEISLQDISQAVLKMWVDKMISDSEYKMLERRIEVMKL